MKCLIEKRQLMKLKRVYFGINKGFTGVSVVKTLPADAR